MAYPTTITNTGANLVTQDADNAAQLWKEGADMFEQTADIFTEMEGGPEAYIQVENDTSKGHGHKIHFRVKSGFYGPGRTGNELFTDPTHFEELMTSENHLQVGLIRNATSSFFMMEEDLGMRGELENGFNEQLGEWMGREKTAQMGLSSLHQCDITNHLVANGRGSVNSLQSGDGLSPDDITTCAAMLASMGGRPAEMKVDGMKNSIRCFQFLTTQHGAASLEVDPDYKANLRAAAAANGMQNALFGGGLVPVGGHMVRKWDVIDHDGVGPVGSFLNPKAYLGIPIVHGTTADLTGVSSFTGICGGADSTSAQKTRMQYFRDFPRYAITFCNGETVSATASTHMISENSDKFYVVIVNPPNATGTDPTTGLTKANKWGMYRVSANSGNQLTVDARLVASASVAGIGVSTLGGVTWDDNVNTTEHPAGSLVYLATDDGKPWLKTLVMGRTYARRGYGMFRNKRMIDFQEGGAIKETYIASIFGQKPRANRRGAFPGLLILHHTGTYAGWRHP